MGVVGCGHCVGGVGVVFGVHFFRVEDSVGWLWWRLWEDNVREGGRWFGGGREGGRRLMCPWGDHVSCVLLHSGFFA